MSSTYSWKRLDTKCQNVKAVHIFHFFQLYSIIKRFGVTILARYKPQINYSELTAPSFAGFVIYSSTEKNFFFENCSHPTSRHTRNRTYKIKQSLKFNPYRLQSLAKFEFLPNPYVFPLPLQLQWYFEL